MADLEKIEIINPAEIKLVCDNSPNFKKSRLYIESNWRQKAPTDNELHIGNKAAMDVLNYQLVPASIALKQIRQRILLADSTGLGKTLEAGILMSELILRGKGKRILVVSSKSMMTQFQKEMWNRCPEVKTAMCQFSKKQGQYLSILLAKHAKKLPLSETEQIVLNSFFKKFWMAHPEMKKILADALSDVINEMD